MFANDMSRLESNYQTPYDNWKKDPSKANTGVLLKAVKPEISKGIRAHVGKSNPLLESRARQIALKAMQTYDPKQAKLGTHIVNQLQGLRRVSRQQRQVLRMPERVAIDANRIETSRNELADRLGRDPNLVELADHTGLSVARMKYVKRFKHPVAEGTLTTPTGEDQANLPAVQQDLTEPWLEVVYGDLDPVNKKIMEWTLGMNDEPQLSNQEIAKRLNVSPGAISQRKAAIQQLIDQQDNLSPF